LVLLPAVLGILVVLLFPHRKAPERLPPTVEYDRVLKIIEPAAYSKQISDVSYESFMEACYQVNHVAIAHFAEIHDISPENRERLFVELENRKDQIARAYLKDLRLECSSTEYTTSSERAYDFRPCGAAKAFSKVVAKKSLLRGNRRFRPFSVCTALKSRIAS